MDKRVIAVIVIVFVVGLVVFVSGCTSDTSKNDPVVNVTDVKVVSEKYGGYACTCTITPNKDIDYVEMVAKWYDDSGALINTSSLLWNVRNVKAGQVVKARGTDYISNNEKPVKVQVFLFNHPFHNDESDAIFNQEIVL